VTPGVIAVWNVTFHPLFRGAKANLDAATATVIVSDYLKPNDRSAEMQTDRYDYAPPTLAVAGLLW